MTNKQLKNYLLSLSHNEFLQARLFITKNNLFVLNKSVKDLINNKR